jgi:hypothetical protein
MAAEDWRFARCGRPVEGGERLLLLLALLVVLGEWCAWLSLSLPISSGF